MDNSRKSPLTPSLHRQPRFTTWKDSHPNFMFHISVQNGFNFLDLPFRGSSMTVILKYGCVVAAKHWVMKQRRRGNDKPQFDWPYCWSWPRCGTPTRPVLKSCNQDLNTVMEAFLCGYRTANDFQTVTDKALWCCSTNKKWKYTESCQVIAGYTQNYVVTMQELKCPTLELCTCTCVYDLPWLL